MTAETDPIVAAPEELTLKSGSVVYVERLRTRQFFALLRILTHGGANALGVIDLQGSVGEEEFSSRLLWVVMMAVPDAPNETVEFLRTMTRPKSEESIVVPAGGYELDKQGKETTATILTAEQRLATELANPELDDTVAVIEAVVRREAPDLKALGKRLMQMWQLANKTGQVEATKGKTKKTLSAVSQEPST
jgi:hypothetical protein